MANDEVELILTTDVGPRIIRYGFLDGQNLLKEFADQLGKSGESKWMPRGGHRVWIAPEDEFISYSPDNTKVHAEIKSDTVTINGVLEPETGVQKQLEVTLAESGPCVKVTNRLANHGAKAIDVASWGPTMMAPGGTAILALPPRGKHPEDLKPTNPLVMWAYTDFSDPRWRFTSRYILLRSEAGNPKPQKTGLFNPNTVAAYLLGSDLFVKRMRAGHPERHPEFSCSLQTFTNAEFLELETMGELRHLHNGDSTSHTEEWSLQRGVSIPDWTDDQIDRALAASHWIAWNQ